MSESFAEAMDRRALVCSHCGTDASAEGYREHVDGCEICKGMPKQGSATDGQTICTTD